MSFEYSVFLARFGLSSFSLMPPGSADLGELIVAISFFARRKKIVNECLPGFMSLKINE